MAQAPASVRELGIGEGLLWRDVRLEALRESPDAFAAVYEVDAARSDADWHEMIDATAADPGSVSLVAEIDGRPVGMAYCRVDQGGSIGGLFAMWVRPEVRGRGVGRALVEHALTWMSGRGASVVELTVTETNVAAMRLYASSGFVETGRREPLREGSPLMMRGMRRDLTTA